MLPDYLDSEWARVSIPEGMQASTLDDFLAVLLDAYRLNKSVSRRQKTNLNIVVFVDVVK